MGAESSPSTMEHVRTEDSDNICEACQAIDFEDAFNLQKVVIPLFRRVCDVDYARAISSCHLCSIFRSSVLQDPPPILVYGDQRLTLLAYRAGEIFGRNDRSNCAVVLVVSPYAGLNEYLLGSTSWALYQTEKCILQEQSMNRNLHGRVIAGEIRWKVLQNWVRRCSNDHEICRAEASDSMPVLRVIDCESRCLKFINKPTQQYVALSYVWGNDDNGDSNADTFPGEFPALIEDAILVTKAIGKQFLWIDRYCICQDDPEEKHTLIQNMGYIYANSHVTIIAALPPEHGVHRGIPGVSHMPRRAQHFQGASHVWAGNRAIIPAPPNVGKEIASSSWSTRGWTYQEALMSPRRLIFTESQAYFQCLQMYCFEGFETGFENTHASESLSFAHTGCTIPSVFPRHGIGENSGAIVERISECWSRCLTYEDDRLKAIAGVLRIFEHKFSLRSLCGLPFCPATLAPPCACGRASCMHRPWIKPGINSLTLTLDWTVLTESDALYPVRCSQFPSWSWTGWKFQCQSPEFSVPACVPTRSIAVKDNHNSSQQSQWSWISSQQNRIAQNSLGPTARVKVEFDDGARRLWDSERDDILSRETFDNLARRLHIRSWVVPFHVNWEEYHSIAPRPSYAGRLGTSQTIYRDSRDSGGLKSILEMACSGSRETSGQETTSKAWGPAHPAPELLAVVMSAAKNGIIALLVTPMPGTTHYQFCGIYRFTLRGESEIPSFRYWVGEKPPRTPFPQVTGNEALDDPETSWFMKRFYYDGIIFELQDVIVA